MSATREVTIWCDHYDGEDQFERCGAWEQGDLFHDTALALRRNLRARGWLVGQSGGKDYCPEHAKVH